MKKTIRVSLDVEFNLSDIEADPDDWDYHRKMLWERLTANPEALTAFLNMWAMVEVAGTDERNLDKIAFGKETSEGDILMPLIQQLPQENREALLESLQTGSACDVTRFYEILDPQIINVELQDVEAK